MVSRKWVLIACTPAPPSRKRSRWTPATDSLCGLERLRHVQAHRPGKGWTPTGRVGTVRVKGSPRSEPRLLARRSRRSTARGPESPPRRWPCRRCEFFREVCKNNRVGATRRRDSPPARPRSNPASGTPPRSAFVTVSGSLDSVRGGDCQAWHPSCPVWSGCRLDLCHSRRCFSPSLTPRAGFVATSRPSEP